MAVEKDKFTVRLKKDAVKVIDALRGDKTRTAYLEDIVNDILFNKIQKYIEKIGSLDRRIDKTALQNAAVLGRIESKIDQLLKSGLPEGPTESEADRREGKTSHVDKKTGGHYDLGTDKGGFNWKVRALEMIASGELKGLSSEDIEVLKKRTPEGGTEGQEWKTTVLKKLFDRTVIVDTVKNHDFIMFLRNERDVF